MERGSLDLQNQARGISDPIDVLSQTFRLIENGSHSLERALLKDESVLIEFQDTLRDLAAAGLASRPKKSIGLPEFLIKGRELLFSNFSLEPAATFRTGESAGIQSTIVPMEDDFLLLELSSNVDGWRLTMEKGAKNTAPLAISLYRVDKLVELFHIKNTVRKDLSQLEPGSYKLVCGKSAVLTFAITHEDEDNNKIRSNHS